MYIFRVSNSLDPDQDGYSVTTSVDPDLGPNCLQRLPLAWKELNNLEQIGKM